jgi:hypothetical protein
MVWRSRRERNPGLGCVASAGPPTSPECQIVEILAIMGGAGTPITKIGVALLGPTWSEAKDCFGSSVRIYLPLPLISTAHLEITRKPHLEGFIKIRAKPP